MRVTADADRIPISITPGEGKPVPSSLLDTDRFAVDLDWFEDAWQGAVPPTIEEALSRSQVPAGPARQALLIELIKIDLGQRWRRVQPLSGAEGTDTQQPARPSIEDYLARFPDLDPLPAELIGEEYWRDTAGATSPTAANTRPALAPAPACSRCSTRSMPS